MRVVIQRPGGYDQLRLERGDPPSPSTDERLLQSLAVGVNYADCVVRMGLYASARKYVGWPITPGFELVGFEPGDPLRTPRLALTRFNAYASHAAIDQRLIFPLPRGYSVEEAAGFPTTALTAWYALRRLCAVESGMRVLVHSAAGGVGLRLLQMCRILGAEAVGLVGAPHKAHTVEACDARVIVKGRRPWWQAARELTPRGYDIVLDATGAETLRHSYDLLAPMGRLVIYGFHSMLPKSASGAGSAFAPTALLRLARTYISTPRFNPLALTGDNKSVLGFNLSYLFDEVPLAQRGMQELLAWASLGKLPPLPTEVFPFAEVAAAHARLESGQTTGKLVLSLER
ncbi:MAG: zinc-binding dehydrogenase [Myxococcales bacterium]|nr:zinc-binding dehydrogenase [Myxococcales bacterium]